MKPLKRTGVQRIICARECGAIFYGTISQLREGMPSCRCGASMVPEHPELAAELLPREQWASHPYLAEFDREVASVMRGQSSHVQRGREVRPAEGIAAERIGRSMAEDATARRRSGLKQYATATAAAEGMPF